MELKTHIEGSGNLIYTIILNTSDITQDANKLRKIISQQFGCSSSIKDNLIIINGRHDAIKLQKIINSIKI
jgi:translation initiation factor 1 (eIF-1/SUI1)